jgi:hypothetical protein
MQDYAVGRFRWPLLGDFAYILGTFNQLIPSNGLTGIPRNSRNENQEMTRTVTSAALSTLLTFCIASLACAEGAGEKTKVLQVTKLTKNLEVRQSQIGFRSTLLFYTFKEQKTVLKLQFGNRDKTFPVTGTVYVFADSVTEEGIKKWLNNQHSDGLFPDVPKPVSHKLPAKVCKVTSHKMTGQTKQRFGEYDNYDVTFEVKDYAGKTGIKLKGFKGATKVHVKTK